MFQCMTGSWGLGFKLMEYWMMACALAAASNITLVSVQSWVFRTRSSSYVVPASRLPPGRSEALLCSAINGRPGSKFSSKNGPSLHFEDDVIDADSDGVDKSSSSGMDPPYRGRAHERKKDAATKGNLGDEPYRIIPGIGKFYLDELDVITLLDPPINLLPLNLRSYNHAAHIWKKIGDIPEERKTRLLELIDPSLMQKMWEIAGMRYDSPKLFVADAFSFLPVPEAEEPFKARLWHGKISQDSWPWSWFKEDFTMVFFVSNDGLLYGRLSCSGLFGTAVSVFMPLYFKVKPTETVPITDEDCDLALDFGAGQLHLKDSLPRSFPKPAKLQWPIEDIVIYIRPAGPGVLVGQLWESKYEPNQAPPRCLARLVLMQDK